MKKRQFKNIELANWLILKAVQEGKSISQMKLHKLLFFAHAQSLVSFNKPLVDGQFLAWDHGPVLKDLYFYTKDFGNNSLSPIPVPVNYIFQPEVVITSDPYEIKMLQTVWKNFGDFSASYLRDISHEPGSPWDLAKKNGKSQISDEEIKAYYKTKTEKIA